MLNINRVSGWRHRKDDPAEICPKEFLEIRSWEILREKALNCGRDLSAMTFVKAITPDIVPTNSVVRMAAFRATWEHSFEMCVEFGVIVGGNACVIDELVANDG